MIKSERLFYGWAIVAISVFAMTLIYGIRHSFSIFFPFILNEFGWTRGSTAIMLSLNILTYGFMAPVAGGLGDRWKPRRVMLSGAVLLAIATAACGFAHKLWHLYLLFGILVPMGMAFSGWPLLAPTLSNWFVKRRGLVIGLGQMGGGISFIYSMFAEFTISQLGWRYAYFVLAGILALLLIPLYSLFFKYRPEERGLRAYGASGFRGNKGTTGEVARRKDPEFRDWTFSSAMKTSQCWLMILSQFLFWGIGVYLVLAHQVKFAMDAGYSSMFSASVFALFGVFMVIGQCSSGISDWIGREKAVIIATVFFIGSLLALILVTDTSKPWLLYLYAIGFGFGAGLYAPTSFAGMADIFHGRCFGEFAGLLLTGMGLGGAIGPWFGGYIYDISNSYNSAFIFCMICACFACLSFWIAAPRNADKIRAEFQGVPQLKRPE
jgi:MFS family permease